MSTVSKINNTSTTDSLQRVNSAKNAAKSVDSVAASTPSAGMGSSTDNPYSNDARGNLAARLKKGGKENQPSEPVADEPIINADLVTIISETEIGFESEKMKNVNKYETNRDSTSKYNKDNSSIEGDV